MGTVHLGVMELEGDGEGISEKFLAVFAPDDKGIIENAAVHAHSTVDFGIDDGGSADDHGVFGQIVVLAGFGDLFCICQIVVVKCGKIIGVENVTGADFTGAVFDDGIDCDRIVMQELFAYGEEIKLLDGGGCFANAMVHEHIEFQIPLTGYFDQIGHIQRFEEGDHGIGGFHPEVIGHGSGGVFGVDFVWHGTS